MKDFNWTEPTVIQFKALHEQGYSYGQIAAEIGCTRNSAIGKGHRLHLAARNSTLPRPPRRVKRPKRQGSANELAQEARMSGDSPTFELPPDRIEDQDIPVKQRRQIHQLENQHCRYPVGVPGQLGFFYCGSPTADVAMGRSYCPSHTAVCLTGKPTRGAPFIPRRDGQ